MNIHAVVQFGPNREAELNRALAHLRHRGAVEELPFEIRRRKNFLKPKGHKKLRAQIRFKEKQKAIARRAAAEATGRKLPMQFR